MIYAGLSQNGFLQVAEEKGIAGCLSPLLGQIISEDGNSANRKPEKKDSGSQNRVQSYPELIEQRSDWGRQTKNSLGRTIVYIMRAVTEQ